MDSLNMLRGSPLLKWIRIYGDHCETDKGSVYELLLCECDSIHSFRLICLLLNLGKKTYVAKLEIFCMVEDRIVT